MNENEIKELKDKNAYLQKLVNYCIRYLMNKNMYEEFYISIEKGDRRAIELLKEMKKLVNT